MNSVRRRNEPMGQEHALSLPLAASKRHWEKAGPSTSEWLYVMLRSKNLTLARVPVLWVGRDAIFSDETAAKGRN